MPRTEYPFSSNSCTNAPATKPVAPVTQTGAVVTGILVEPIDGPNQSMCGYAVRR